VLHQRLQPAVALTMCRAGSLGSYRMSIWVQFEYF